MDGGKQPGREDKSELRGQAPLTDALLDFACSGRESWHTPGHRGGHDLPDWIKNNLSGFDVTELPETDDLNHAKGPARQAMLLAAEAFDAGITRFITSGSTVALQILLALYPGRGGRLLLSRCVHQSIIHTAALLDLSLSWIKHPVDSNAASPFSLLPQVTVQEIETSMENNPDCQAVLITSPDYYGSCADLPAIAEAVHRRGKVLLVDEAHGAHLNFGRDVLPAGAMQAGADACVQSGHKTLPVLTPGAYLHLGRSALAGGLIDAARLDQLLPVFQTSSPSFPIAATLDYARAWLTSQGRYWIGRQLEHLRSFRAGLPPEIYCSPAITRPDFSSGFLRDPLRLIITGQPASKLGFPARQAADQLAHAGIDIEFADLTRLVLIPSLQQPAAIWQHLGLALRQINLPAGSASLLELEKAWRYFLAEPPLISLSPGTALLGPGHRQLLPVREAAGRICAQSVVPYPPGIPLMIPGERIDQDRVDFLRRLLDNKVSINGINQGNLLVVA